MEEIIQTTGATILLKAVDFLFDEGRKILQERRARRETQSGKKSGEQTPPSLPVPAESQEAVPVHPESVTICTKEDAMKQKLARSAWLAYEKEIQHLLRLKDTYTNNYWLAKEQYAKFGSAYVPQVVVHNLEEAEDGIADTMYRLRDVLDVLYGKTIVIPGLDEDDEP